MRKLLYFFRKHSKVIARSATYIISVIVLMIIYPHKGSFPYEFQKGKPWMHNDLYATFDFPIYKTENELKAEHDSILKEFKPYFNYNSSISSDQLKKFNKNFNNTWLNYSVGNASHKIDAETLNFFKNADTLVRNYYNNFISAALQFVFDKGIVQLTETIENYKKKDFPIVILKNKVGEDYDFSDVFVQKTAYEYIIHRLETLKTGTRNDQFIFASGFFKDLDLNEIIIPNLVFNEEVTKNVKNELVKKISLTKGMFVAGKKVIGKGEIVSDERFAILFSYKNEYENKSGNTGSNIYLYIGHGILIASLLFLLILFFASFRREVYTNTVRYSFVLLLVVAVVGISGIFARKGINLYVLPFALLPIIINTFYDARLAMFVHTVAILLTGFMVPNSFEFVFLNFITGSVAILNVSSIYRRRKLFEVVMIVFATYFILYTAIFLLQGNIINQISYKNYFPFIISSSLLLMAYPFIYIFERIFGFLSDITLLELSDTNQPLLRELNEKAPGTFQHSLQVANLAEEAAYKIGANPLMVRAGALYHDIGKMHNPLYFIENLSLEKNPHDNITFEASAKVIIDHVTRGIDIARKHKLPEQIIDFIRTHHGNSTVQFFYVSFKKQNPESEIDKSKFTYPGPIAHSKETALVMMADSVEAASRSIKEFNKDIINDLVDNIIYYQMINNQYNDSSITYKEIGIVKNVFKRKLMNIYHIRLEYPEMD